VALARKLTAAGAAVVFLSTDKVGDGRGARRARHAPRRPRTEYGRQKAAAERRLLALPGAVAVLRLSKVLDPSLPLLTQWAAALRAGRPVDAFADMHLAPIDLPRIAALVEALVVSRARGIFHCTGGEERPYAALALALAEAAGARPELVRAQPADPVQHPPAARPPHSSLDMRLERRRFGVGQPGFDDVVRPIARKLCCRR
jgi:dTDP-4-dehydrorhamnose reductase